MCGIVCYIAGEDQEPFDIEKLKTLFLWNALLRGMDATGFYTPKNGLIKNNDDAPKFLTDNSKNILPDSLFIGHVRSGTVGSNKKENAHPFERGDCILVHNGTIKNHWSLLTKRELNWNDYNVDSDVIAGCISYDKNASVLSEIDGAAAVVFHDKKDPSKIYVMRNSERDLFKGYIGTNMYISSIKEALEYIGCVCIKEFKQDLLYTIQNAKILTPPKKINNKPYQIPVSNNPDTAKKAELTRSLYCNIRSSINCTITRDVNTIRLIKDNYYRVVGILNQETFDIFDPVTKTKMSISKRCFNLEDVIRSKDYVRFSEDIKYADSTNDRNSLVFRAGQVVQVYHSAQDGTAIFKVENNANIRVKKYLMYKLSEEDLEEYKKENGIMIPLSNMSYDPDHLRSNVGINPHTPLLTESSPFKEEVIDLNTLDRAFVNRILQGANLRAEDVEVIEEVNEDKNKGPLRLNLDIAQTEDILTDFFITMDNKIEELKELTNSGDLPHLMIKILDLEDINYKTFDKILKTDAG